MYFVSLFKDLYSNHDCRRGLRNVACMALIILYCCIGCCPRRRIRVAWAAAAIREKETEEEGRRKLTLGADEKAAYPEMGKINRHIWLRKRFTQRFTYQFSKSSTIVLLQLSSCQGKVGE